MKTPNAVLKISPYTQRIIMICNLSELGTNLSPDDITMEDAYYINYFGMKRQQKEDEMKFKTLFENLAQLLSKLFK